MTGDLLIRARRAVTARGEAPAAVLVDDGVIRAVAGSGAGMSAAELVDLGDDVVLMPGLVDSHVHVNEPGHPDWESFGTATRAAAAGGITTLVDMPVDSVPVTVDVAALEAKRAAAAGQCHVDVGVWGGAVPGNLGDLRALHEAGVAGFKCFMNGAGGPDFPPLRAAALVAAMGVLRQLDAVLLVHADVDAGPGGVPPGSGPAYRDFLAAHPARTEDAAVAAVLEAAAATGARAHIVHVSSAGALEAISAAQRNGLRISAETCPHYLTFSAEEVPDGATQFKCSPPIREAANRERLWAGLARGTLGMVVSDHSPCAPEMKHHGTGDFGLAWGGISSLQLGLPVMWTAARERGFTLADIARWMSAAPATLAGLRAKGRIAPGFDADLCAFAPDQPFVVDPARLHHRQPMTPYAARQLSGVVRRTWLRGRGIDPARPAGRLLGHGGLPWPRKDLP
jgi:allantoinase